MKDAGVGDGGPAFPRTYRDTGTSGMSLRDWFAGQALPARTADWYARTDEGVESLNQMARQCYRIADAMLTARAPTNSEVTEP